MIDKIKKYYWLILASLGFWIPTKKLMPLMKYGYDWVLISYVDAKGKGIRCIPEIAEYSERSKQWHFSTCDYDSPMTYYLNDDCMITHWRKIPTFRKTYYLQLL